jgi:hypothetical protein
MSDVLTDASISMAIPNIVFSMIAMSNMEIGNCVDAGAGTSSQIGS